MSHAVVARRVVVALLAGLALLACESPRPPQGPILAIDVKIEQPDGVLEVRKATLLLDGKEVAVFTAPRPESLVVFSKTIEGVKPGPHRVEIRVDEQDDSPTVYSAGGLVNYGGKPHQLQGVGEILETGKTFHWDLKL
jgi:hypothetical protein